MTTRTFRELHEPGNPFVLANAWNVGSARLLAALGAEAIGTTSSGFAFTLGRRDGEVTRDEALRHAEELVGATPLPVSADLESGYATDRDGVAATVRDAATIGLAGCSIEDTDRPSGSYPFDTAIDRVRAAVDAARSAEADFVLVARADGILTRTYGLDEAVDRIRAFADVGADCVYIPGLPDLDAVARVCSAVDVPVNVLPIGPLAGCTREEFATAGAARISIGGALANVTHRALYDAAAAMLSSGTFSGLTVPRDGVDLTALLDAGAGVSD